MKVVLPVAMVTNMTNMTNKITEHIPVMLLLVVTCLLHLQVALHLADLWVGL